MEANVYPLPCIKGKMHIQKISVKLPWRSTDVNMLLNIKANFVVIAYVIAYLSHTYGMHIETLGSLDLEQ